MDCLEFRRILDLYVDGELSLEAAAAASAHTGDCFACRRTEQELRRLRQAVKDTLRQHEAPAGLADRISRAIFPRRSRAGIAALAAMGLLVLSLVSMAGMPGVRASLADGMEQVAFRLDHPQTLVLEGEIVCRECKLFSLYGSPEERDLNGHHGALQVPEGKIWDFMENETAGPLLHDASLLGKRVRVQARLYRRAGCLEVMRYQILEVQNAG